MITTLSTTVTIAQMEKELILMRFKFLGFNKTKTAQSLGICIRTLDNKLAEYEGRASEGASGANGHEGREGTEFQGNQGAQPNGGGTAAGMGVESDAKDSSKQSMSVRKRTQVQKVLLSDSA